MSRTDQLDPMMPDGLATVIADADPIPFDLLQSLRSSLARRASGAEVAELVYDSVLDGPGDVRSFDGARQLSFQGPEISLEMEVAWDRRRVLGQLIPPRRGEVEMRHGRGSDRLSVDELGRFAVDDLPKGPVSFRYGGGAGEPTTVTDWVVL